MNHTIREFVLAGLVGVVFGFISAHSPLFSTSWIALIFWGIVGVAIGFLSRGKREAMVSGGVYGFFLVLSFLAFGFHGASTQVSSFVLLMLVLGVIGIVCGLITSWIGLWIKNSNKK
jgi:hypothetical protein